MIFWSKTSTDTGVMVLKGEEETLLIGWRHPNWMKIPEHAKHNDAGKVFRVDDFTLCQCICEHDHKSFVYTLKRSSLCVVRCSNHGWMVLESVELKKARGL